MDEGFPEVIPTKSRNKERIVGAGARREKIQGLKKVGFNNEQEKWIEDKLVTVALPVYNLKSLHRKENKYGSENTLGSWGYGIPNYGEFSIYELLDKQINEKKIGTIAHESAHANTPFNENNTFIFGSEATREAAAKHAIKVANQTVITKKFLNGYHRHLHDKYIGRDIPKKDRISLATFQEETWAIMTELAITNRAHLEQVQEAQHKSLYKLKIEGENVPEKVYLISHQDEKGEVVVNGVDIALINLVDGVDTLDALKEHVISLKGEFYSNNYYEIAKKRALEEERKKKKKKREEKAALLTEQQLLKEVSSRG